MAWNVVMKALILLKKEAMIIIAQHTACGPNVAHTNILFVAQTQKI